MVNKEHLDLRLLWTAFFLILAAMIFAGLYPFNFFPPNRAHWILNDPGLYFDGAGIAYTDQVEPINLKKALSITLLLRERHGSQNWGPKEIFSIYDGPGAPSFLIGQWDRQIFIFSRFEKNEGKKWYRQFRAKYRLPRGKPQVVTVTFNEREKAIYVDGKLRNLKPVALEDKVQISFSGRLLIGSSPRGKFGWRGEIKGLALYSRILSSGEIAMHSRKIFQEGVSVLAETSGCSAVYPFDEGNGSTARSILNNPRPFIIPAGLCSLSTISLGLAHKDMRFYGFGKKDFLNNVLYFVLFGAVLSALIIRKHATGYFLTLLIVTSAGGLLSGFIEGLQLFLYTRQPGMADILANILGSGFGMQVTVIILEIKKIRKF